MKNTQPGLSLEVIWLDDDLMELRLSAASKCFAGTTTFYAAFEEPSLLARSFEGFPAQMGEVREHVLGGKDLPGYGEAHLHLSCRDQLGHLDLRVSLLTEAQGTTTPGESVTLMFGLVPAQIDAFVEQLIQMKAEVGSSVLLVEAV